MLLSLHRKKTFQSPSQLGKGMSLSPFLQCTYLAENTLHHICFSQYRLSLPLCSLSWNTQVSLPVLLRSFALYQRSVTLSWSDFLYEISPSRYLRSAGVSTWGQPVFLQYMRSAQLAAWYQLVSLPEVSLFLCNTWDQSISLPEISLVLYLRSACFSAIHEVSLSRYPKSAYISTLCQPVYLLNTLWTFQWIFLPLWKTEAAGYPANVFLSFYHIQNAQLPETSLLSGLQNLPRVLNFKDPWIKIFLQSCFSFCVLFII